MRTPFYLAIVGLCAAPLASAQETVDMDVSSRLLDSSGGALEGTHDLTVRLWSADTGGTLLHTEAFPAATVDQGYFTGALHPEASDFVFGQTVYVETSVNGTPMSPRQRLGAVPRAAVANGLPSAMYGSASEALADDLITYYAFESTTPLATQNCSGATITPTAGGGSGLCYGETEPAPGIVGLGMDRGTGIDHGVRVDIGGDYSVFTLSLWFYHSSLSVHSANDGGGIVWLNGDDTAGTQLIGLNNNPAPGSLKWGYWPRNAGTTGAADEGRYAGMSLASGQWVHYGLTQDALGTSNLYINGVLVDSRTDFTWNLGQTVYVANYYRPTGSNTNAHFARGTADELALWSRALTGDEIGRIFRAQRGGQHIVP